MALKKISELTSSATLTGAELVEVVQSGNSRQATIRDILDDALYPETAAESSASLTPSAFSRTPHPIDVRRYGITANDTGSRASNTSALKNVLDPSVTGPVGRLIFPNISGNDTYYFDDIIQIRRGVFMNLDDSTLDFAKSYESADDLMGFLTFIGDVLIENGAINLDYDGSAGTNAGSVMRIGSREGYKFGTFTGGINDEDLSIPMGNILLRNLRITTNNPAHCILMLGGLKGVVLENIHIDGQGSALRGIYYEFGDYHYSETPASHTSSHAVGMTFSNIHVKDLDTSLTGANAMSIIGAWSTKVSGLYVDTADGAFVFRPGEALFFNPGDPELAGIDRVIVLENIFGNNLTSVSANAITLTGAESSSGGYLSGTVTDPEDQTDLMRFSLNGFAVDSIINVSGACDIRNGTITGAGTSGGLILGAECVQFDVDNVSIRDGAGVGIRAEIDNGIWSTARNKIGSIRNCHIAGNTGAGISLGICESVLVENCRIGYNSLYDAGNESTQTIGVSVSSTGKGVVCRGNFVTTSGGAVAYNLAGTGDRGCVVENSRGVTTTNGPWKIDGIARDTATNIADASAAINTTDKYTGKRVWDTSNNRLMYALGSATTSAWRISDGSASVTPS